MRRIRWQNKELAAAAGLDKDTVGRVLAGRGDAKLSTLDKIEAAIAAEEQRLRTELNGGVAA